MNPLDSTCLTNVATLQQKYLIVLLYCPFLLFPAALAVRMDLKTVLKVISDAAKKFH
jgi:hypothetical protein